jgi:hypothetical protein
MCTLRASARKPRLNLTKLALSGVAAAWLFHVAPSHACGPCTTHELWGVQQLNGELVVVSNFGLLSQAGDGWLLTCEEAIGGLLLNVQGDAAASLVSTETGIFTRTGDICDWDAGAVLASNQWALGGG